MNQTRPHCVNQMGKIHSKPLAARHGRETAWARHVMCESALRAVEPWGEKKFALVVESKHMGQMINQSLFPTHISTPRFLPNLDKAGMGKFNFGSHTTIITTTVHEI